MGYHSESTHGIAGKEPGASARRASDAVERATELSTRAAAQPFRSAIILLAANVVAIAAMVLAGELAFGDPAEPFRELMPGTWLSAAQLAFVAVVAWTIHRELMPGPRLRLDNFWGVSVVVFSLLAIDEATQLTIYAADALASLGAAAPSGFTDLDAFLLAVVLLAGAAALLRFAWTLRSYPAAVALMAVGVAFGAVSQLLDSTLAVTSTEIVVEESLKLTAEPFVIGGYLLVLNRVLRRRDHG